MQDYGLEFTGPDEKRLDHFLAQSLPQFSRSRLQGLIRRGSVWIDGIAAVKAGQMLVPGSHVSVKVPAPEPTGLQAESIPLDVIYEDDDVLIVNKPAGMVVHPGAGHKRGTLVNAAVAHDGAMMGVGGEERPGVVHRLDKDTSGLIALAKNDPSLHWLQEQFQAREVHKTYLALVDGRPPTASGKIQAPIGRDPAHRRQMSILREGKGRDAVTEYSTREMFDQHALLELHPVTGRTHQIRLHCAFLGCPVVGDRIYGRRRPSIPMERHFLHAWKLELVLPSASKRREFVAPLPQELEVILSSIRMGISRPAEKTER
jgi:23S rRNA pseudouridine1911/1915/1917 synthase